MKKNLLFLICILIFVSNTINAKNYTIVNVGMTFSPALLTIEVGDTVTFNLAAIHGVNQVSKSVYNASGNTLLTGGYQMAVGSLTGFHVFTAPDTFYYVCPPHAVLGMKGIIIVNAKSATSIETLQYGKISLYPNPANNIINLKLTLISASKVNIDLYDMTGRNVLNLLHAQLSEGEFNQSFNLDKNIPSGRYFIQLTCANGCYAVPLIISRIR